LCVPVRDCRAATFDEALDLEHGFDIARKGVPRKAPSCAGLYWHSGRREMRLVRFYR
jgi:hypothetical protein